MRNHPNAVIGGAGGGSGLGTLTVWLLGRYHVHLTQEQAAAIAGGVAALVLFVGRNGLRGVWRTIMDGSGRRPNG